MNKTRLEAFSDGVFAIIVTIMVLEIKIPHGTDWSAIVPLLPVLGSYAISFMLIGTWWVNHHHLLRAARHINTKIMYANLLALFWLSLMPVATGWMGENGFANDTVALYAALLTMSGATFFILAKQVSLSNSSEPAMVVIHRRMDRKGRWSLALYLLAIPCAYLHPAISLAMFGGLFILWMMPDKQIEEQLGKAGSRD